MRDDEDTTQAVPGGVPRLQALPPPVHHVPWNGYAITSVVLGVISVGLFGLIFGVAALVAIRRDPDQRGRGLAITGIALSIVWLILAAIFLPGALNRIGEPPTSGSAKLFTLRAGDCFDRPAKRAATAAVDTAVTVVPCTRPHQAEVVGRIVLDGVPGVDDMYVESVADSKCRTKMDEYVLDPLSLPPDAELYWYASGGSARSPRILVCFLDVEDRSVTRPLREDVTTLTPDQVRYLTAVRGVDAAEVRLHADPPPPFTTLRLRAAELADAQDRERILLRQGPWPAATQPAVDGLIAILNATVPLWRQAGQTVTEAGFDAVARQVTQYDDHAAAIAVRRTLGLSTAQGEPAHRP